MSQLAHFSAADEAQMVALGGEIGRACSGGGVLYLKGTLGMGKTTLSRGVIQAFGHQGAVKSPTYTLVEPYELEHQRVYHFDLYRLADPEELEYMGIRDYFEAGALCLVEWPDKGRGMIPAADLIISIEPEGRGRRISLLAETARGIEMLTQLVASQ